MNIKSETQPPVLKAEDSVSSLVAKMVKTKGGRLMNPTDAFRKEQRKREIQRNKLERKYQREAHRLINDPDELKQELQSVLEAEKEGMLNKTLRLKKKVLQEAFDQALKRKKVRL